METKFSGLLDLIADAFPSAGQFMDCSFYIILSLFLFRYLCSLSEEEIRMPNTRAMADLMLSTIKVDSENESRLERFVSVFCHFVLPFTEVYCGFC